VANSVLWRVGLVWFSDNDLLWAETCSSILCDIIKTSKEQNCAIFVLPNFTNRLATMHGMNSNYLENF